MSLFLSLKQDERVSADLRFHFRGKSEFRHFSLRPDSLPGDVVSNPRRYIFLHFFFIYGGGVFHNFHKSVARSSFLPFYPSTIAITVVDFIDFLPL